MRPAERVLYEREGEKNLVRAYMWFLLCEECDPKETSPSIASLAELHRDELKGLMTPDEIKVAETLAKGWREEVPEWRKEISEWLKRTNHAS
jgi:hypothetical protein